MRKSLNIQASVPLFHPGGPAVLDGVTSIDTVSVEDPGGVSAAAIALWKPLVPEAHRASPAGPVSSNQPSRPTAAYIPAHKTRHRRKHLHAVPLAP
ncbi:hypothetical protein [Pelodictyon luteolum]|nr:hypothetical protein [Pelodictyon luteolum]